MSHYSKEAPHGPPEPDNVTAREYARAINGLRDFLGFDTTSLKTIEDLSAQASLIGEDIAKIVVATGEILKPIPIWGIRKPVEDHVLFVMVLPTTVEISAYRMNSSDEDYIYTVWLPAHDDIKVTDIPRFNLSSVCAYDCRGTSEVGYFPAKDSANAAVQQGFAKVLQEAVREVLLVTPPPEQVSEGYDFI